MCFAYVTIRGKSGSDYTQTICYSQAAFPLNMTFGHDCHISPPSGSSNWPWSNCYLGIFTVVKLMI